MKFTVYEITSINQNHPMKYIGISRDIIQRIRLHKTDSNNINSPRYNNKIYDYIRKHGGWVMFNINTLEEVDCDECDKGIYERKWYDLNRDVCLNNNVPNQSANESFKQYYKNNKEQLVQKANDYYKTHKFERALYYLHNKHKFQIYYQTKKALKNQIQVL